MNLFAKPELLVRLIEASQEKMKTFLVNRHRLLRYYVSRFYGKSMEDNNDSMPPTPINWIYQAVTTMVPNLVYHDPKVMVSTEFLPYRPYGELLELATNYAIKKIGLATDLRMAITDSLFLAGFVRVGICASDQIYDIDGVSHDVGRIYADRISPDDIVLDPLASSWNEQKFIGNRYMADLDYVRELPDINYDVLDKMQEASIGKKEARRLSSEKIADEHETLTEEGHFLDLWFPDEGIMATYGYDTAGRINEEPVRVTDYEGPSEGPYHMLGLSFVPDNILPVAPSLIWHDLHVLANRVAKKQGDQALRTRRVLAYSAKSWEDAKAVRDSEDGATVRVDDVDSLRDIEFGGVSEAGYDYISWAKAMFSELAMNLDLLSGAQSNEPTATQAEMVQANTTVRLADMQKIVYEFTANISRDIAYFLHTDPLIELPLIKRKGGNDVQVMYTPDMRQGDWFDYMLKIAPYSMSRQDPNTKVRRVMEFAANIIPGLAQAYQMLGPVFNIENAIKIVANEMNLEEVDELINSPLLQMQQERMRQAIEMNVPMDPKVMAYLMGVPAVADQQGQTGMQQPNPYGNMAPPPQQQLNQDAQMGAAPAQREQRMGANNAALLL